ncbi:MAG: plasmid stabilization protein [Parcubacteria group bacterium Gr01-1014_66]|nr:MAG: plasmid stabilization protein [Parcubacteria group bacterium Gr01-1014_66]
MRWVIDFTHDAEKFLGRNHMERERALDLVELAIRKFGGEVANVNIKKLKGAWRGFYRIKRGDLRIIASFDFEHSRALIEQIDWRGNAYKE